MKVTADESNDNCPVHGYPAQDRCRICSRFMPRPQVVDPYVAAVLAKAGGE